MTPATVRRLWFWIPPLVLLLGLLAWLFAPRPVAVDLATVGRGPLSVSVTDEGRTRVKDVFVLSAPVAGRMERVELEAGDAVRADDTVVARIEPSDPAFLDVRSSAEAEAGLRAAEATRAHSAAELRRVQAELEFARAELVRYEGLAQRHMISANDLDAARSRARTAEAALQESQAGLRVSESQVEEARARLLAPTSRAVRQQQKACECVIVRSPVSGRVLRVVTESEGVVLSGTPLIEIGDPRRLEVVVELLSTDAVKVQAGLPALIEGWGGDSPLRAVVRRVEPYGFTKVSALGVEEQRVNVLLDFTDPPDQWQRLGHGFRVEPRIVLWQASDVLKVPLAALYRDDGAWMVFRDERGRAEPTRVRIGHENGLEAEVLGGLAAGDRVVLHPSDRVAPGRRIEPRTPR